MDDDQLSDLLSEFARTLVTDFPIQRILDHLVRRIVDVLPIRGAGVTLISPATAPHFVAASDDAAMRFEQLQTDLGDGPCLAAYLSGEAVSAPDLAHESRFPLFSTMALAEGLVAVFTFPLRDGDRRLGALDLYGSVVGPLSKSEMSAAQMLADVTTAYLLNAQARVDLEIASESAREKSLHDDLTGLPNRALLLDRLKHALDGSRRTNTTVGVLFVDLDRFKLVNDSFGHHVGDDLLVAVANRIAGLLRPSDTLARLAGDEFVIVLDQMVSQQHSRAVARRIERALVDPFVLPATEVLISASVGIAFTRASDWSQEYDEASGAGGVDGSSRDTAERLLREADLAMYQVKQNGGRSHGHVNLRELTLSDQRLTLSNDLRTAWQRGDLRPEYQPILATATRVIVGAEALLRWNHPRLGPIPPTVFVPLAEQSGLIMDLGRFVLEQACIDRASWTSPDGIPRMVTVNVSPHQLLGPDFVGSVERILLATGTEPGLVTLEVTETALIHDRERAQMVLEQLSQVGVRLALDDFGTGGSSLSHLRDFSVDTVKVDKTFVGDLSGTAAAGRHIVEAVVHLAHRLGLTVVAEGVETHSQYDAVLALDCDYLQGFLFSPSLTVVELNRLLSHERLTAQPRPTPQQTSAVGLASDVG